MAIKILGMTEQEFYESTPRKLFALADIHRKVNSDSSEQDNNNNSEQKEELYIDNIIF